jgi:hypothetical protein
MEVKSGQFVKVIEVEPSPMKCSFYEQQDIRNYIKEK